MATEASSAGTVTVVGSLADSAEKESVGVTGGAEIRGVDSSPFAASSVGCEEGGAIAAPTITTIRRTARSTSGATIHNPGRKLTRRTGGFVGVVVTGWSGIRLFLFREEPMRPWALTAAHHGECRGIRRRFITNPAAPYWVRASNRERCSRPADSDTRDPMTCA